jgi:hypothetical protein
MKLSDYLEKLENIQKTFKSKIQDVIGLDYHET